MAVTLAQFLVDRPKLEVARPDEGVAEAMARMLEYDYSQLPVVAVEEGGKLSVRGMLSTAGIARAALHLGLAPEKLRVRHAVEQHPHTAKRSEDLWRTLDRVQDGQAVLVLDESEGLVGILTNYDFAAYLRRLTEDSLSVADIETTVRQLILRHYQGREADLQEAVLAQVRGRQRSTMGDVRKLLNECLQTAGASPATITQEVYRAAFEKFVIGDVNTDFERLTFDQFITIFLSAECWSDYEVRVGVPRDAVKRLLEAARDLRNRLAHQRGTLDPAERDRVNYCRQLLNAVADISVVGENSAVTTQTITPAPPNPDNRVPEEAGPPTEKLTGYLAAIEEDRIALTFEEVAKQLVHHLPPSAYEHRSWWTNDEESPQAALWLLAGRRVTTVNMTTGVVTFGRNTGRERAYISIFSAIFRNLEGTWGSKLPSPAGRSWQSIANLPERNATARVVLAFTASHRFRVELYIDTLDAEKNKAAFDALRLQAAEIDTEVGVPLEWDRLDNKQACRVAVYYAEKVWVESDDQDLERLTGWVAEVAPRFRSAMAKHYPVAH